MRVASILLAAGGSTRLGSPKQLLLYGGQSLLRLAAATVQAVGCSPVVVVLGARAAEMRAELTGLDVTTIENTGWERGMGSSLRLGLETLLRTETPPDGILLALCDQPLVAVEHLHALLDAFAAGSPLVAAAYGESVGVPAVFGQRHLAELLALPDHSGAKALLMAHRQNLTLVSLPQAATDIDTREQYDRLTRTR